jgi:hypothetical protein
MKLLAWVPGHGRNPPSLISSRQKILRPDAERAAHMATALKMAFSFKVIGCENVSQIGQISGSNDDAVKPLADLASVRVGQREQAVDAIYGGAYVGPVGGRQG